MHCDVFIIFEIHPIIVSEALNTLVDFDLNLPKTNLNRLIAV